MVSSWRCLELGVFACSLQTLAVDAWGLYAIVLNLWAMTLRSGTLSAVVFCLACRNPKFRPTRLVELRH